MVEAVIFDWGGTLTPWHDIDLRAQWYAYAEVYDPPRARELAAALHACEEDSWRLGREQHRSHTIDGVFRGAGVEPTGGRHQAALDAYLGFWDPHTHVDGDAPAVLAGLRERGVLVGVLSNTLWPRGHHEKVFHRDGVLHLLDGAVYSSEIPWTKPHPEAFRAAMAAVGVHAPQRCVFVGDRPHDDIRGAQGVGMRAVLVPHSRFPDDGVVPDATVQRLSELLPLVDAWREG
ncbi:MAG: HAD family hydrolase [Carbonactinosporaceae bacterium]